MIGCSSKVDTNLEVDLRIFMDIMIDSSSEKEIGFSLLCH